jgi:hypothetical protein
MMAFRPIQTLVREGTPQPAQWFRIDVESAQKAFA